MTQLTGHQDNDKKARRVTLVLGDITGNDDESNQVSATNPLPVVLDTNITISGNDIQIGAVEIKNHDSDVRLTVYDDTDPTIAATDNPALTAGLNYGYDVSGTAWEKLQVSKEDGEVRLLVDARTRPAGAAQRNIPFLDPVVPKNGGSVTQDEVIGNGLKYFVERFQGGGYTANSKVELWFGEPMAGEVGMTLVQAIYIDSSLEETTVNTEFTGNGTKVLRVKLTNNTSQVDEMFGQIIGFDA